MKTIISFMKGNWFELALLTVLVIVISGTFFWYEVRPARISNECNWESIEKSKEVSVFDSRYNIDTYEHYYKRCLRDKGLEK